jgi:DNA-binding Xre family transcriptional regulator
MMTVNISEVARQRGITTAYQLQKALDISPTVAARLWKGEFDMIGLVTLDKLCRVLRCQPSKLLRHVPDSR